MEEPSPERVAEVAAILDQLLPGLPPDRLAHVARRVTIALAERAAPPA